MEKEKKEEQFFDEALVAGLIREWLKSRDEETFAAILKASAALLRVQFYRMGLPDEDDDDARSRVYLKLFKALPLFDPAKGRAFTFLSITIFRELLSFKKPRAESRYLDRNLDGEALDAILENSSGETPEPVDRERLKEIAGAVRRIKTPKRRLADRKIQRWIVRVLLETDFRPRRQEVAEVLRKVFRLSPARARRLYDLTVLSLRRELLGERAPGALDSAGLTSNHDKALLRYRDALSPPEFARLLFLMRGLSSTLIQEFSLEEILYGFAKERLLFAYWSSHGRKASPEARAKMRAAKLGRKVSRETRRRMSAGLRGWPRGKLSPQHRAKISAAKRGHVVSVETRARMSAALKGRPQAKPSAETRAKMSAAARARERRRRVILGSKGEEALFGGVSKERDERLLGSANHLP